MGQGCTVSNAHVQLDKTQWMVESYLYMNDCQQHKHLKSFLKPLALFGHKYRTDDTTSHETSEYIQAYLFCYSSQLDLSIICGFNLYSI